MAWHGARPSAALVATAFGMLVALVPSTLTPAHADATHGTGVALRSTVSTADLAAGSASTVAQTGAPRPAGVEPAAWTVLTPITAPELEPTAEPAPEPAPAPAPEPEPTPAAPAPDCAVLACVALTFDDGPGPYTGTLLNTLAAKGVKATFFVLGSRVAQFPDLAARTAAEGHALGSHAWSHQSLTSMPVEQAADEIDSTTVILIQTVGIGGPVLFRPPYGAFDEQVRLTLAERGQPVVLWDVDTEDWKNRDVGVTTHRAVAGASPGSIILMHDIHESTVAAVPGIIDHLQAAGYTLVTLPELLGPTEPGQVYRSR